MDEKTLVAAPLSAALLLVCRLYSGAENGCTCIDGCSPDNDAGHDCSNDDCAGNDCTDDNHNRSSRHNHETNNHQTAHDPGNDNKETGLRRTRVRHPDNGVCFARRHICQRHLVADERSGVDSRGDCGNDERTQRNHHQAGNDRQTEGRSVRRV